MRFYQFEYRERVVDKISGVQVEVPHNEWFGSEREAVVRRLSLFKAGKLVGKKKEHPIWPVDIPTDKRGLLAFLRKEVV